MTGSDGRSAVELAGVWVPAFLEARGGTARAGDVLTAAATAGHNGRTCRRACAGIGVTMTRAGFGNGSTWTLSAVPNARPTVPNDAVGQAGPSAADDADDAPAEPEPTRPKTWRVPGRPDIYGRVTTYTEVSSREAAGHWDERQWQRIDE